MSESARDYSREMTVAHIREQERAGETEVIFLESARFYSLLRSHPDYDRLLASLRVALEKGHSVIVRLSSPDSDVIEDVREPGAR